MYEITVKSEFCAAHALTISGVREEVHGHNWQVTVAVGGENLDPDGLLCDFHTVEEVLETIIEPFNNRDLNRVAPFDKLNPSAEHVARHIAREMGHRLDHALAPFARVMWASVTEAPGCTATYRNTQATT